MEITRREVRIDLVNGSKIWLDFTLSNEEANSVDGIANGLGGDLGNTVPGIDGILSALVNGEAQAISNANQGRGVGVNINYDLIPGPLLTRFNVFSL